MLNRGLLNYLAGVNKSINVIVINGYISGIDIIKKFINLAIVSLLSRGIIRAYIKLANIRTLQEEFQCNARSNHESQIDKIKR